jgi:hypothetical protein
MVLLKRFLSTGAQNIPPNLVNSGSKRITFAKQLELPVLPIPTLKDTAARYLSAIEGLSGVTKDDLTKERAHAENFEKQAKVLQAELEKLADEIQVSYSKPLFPVVVGLPTDA